MATNIISTEALTLYIDAIVNMYCKARGSDPTDDQAPANPNGFGFGVDSDWGVGSHLTDLLEAVVSAADAGVTGIDPIVALGNSAQNLQNKLNIGTVARNYFSEPLSVMQSHIASSTNQQSVDAYLKYLNTEDATPWQLLVPPVFNELHNYLYGAYMSPENVWYEVLQGIPASNPNVRVYENALGKILVAGTFTTGVTINSASYCGGFPKLKITALTGNGDVEVTGWAFDPETVAVVEGVTWVATNVLSLGTVSLEPGGTNPAPDNSLIVKATNGTATNGITAMTAYVEAHRPTGRSVFNY